MFRSKLRVLVDGQCDVSIADIVRTLTAKYNISYCGKHRMDTRCFLYIQNKTKMSPNVVNKLLNPIITVYEVGAFETLEGDVIECEGIFRKPKEKLSTTNKRLRNGENNQSGVNHTGTVNNGTINNINNGTINNITHKTIQYINVNINPIGMESLDHITPEFLQKLLSEHHGPDVVFRFGTKMYSLQENMNFKTDPKNGFISGRLEQDGAWETHRKCDGFNMLMDNLKNKNEEAVLKHIESLPYEDLLNFERDMGWIHEHKTSGLQEDVPVYQKFIRDGFNLLSANIADKKRRIERDTGKKMKLV